MRTLLPLILFVATSFSASAQDSILKYRYPGSGDTSVDVESLFGNSARQGSLPFRVTIRNNSGRDRVWTVQLSEGNPGRPLNTSSSYRIAVENGSEAQENITFPFAPGFLAYDYRNLNVRVISPGLTPAEQTDGEQTNRDFPSLAMSDGLAQRSLVRLNAECKDQNSSNPFFAKAYDPTTLPTDWKGYTGLDALLIQIPEWTALSPAQRAGVLSWVRIGGILDLYEEGIPEWSTLLLPQTPVSNAAKSMDLSLGQIRLLSLENSEIPNRAVDLYTRLTSRAELLNEDHYRDWPLEESFGTRPFNPTLVMILLIAFAIIVAPVNLFYLAKPGQRHRLFVTTPIISITACLLLIILIFFTDGMGGKGKRVILADLQSGRDEMRLYTVQEQISRTGVMIHSGFTPGRSYDLNPVRLPSRNDVSFSNQRGTSVNFDFSDDNFEGGFFPSRTDQAFVIRSVEPTRARIEILPAESDATGPEVLSNLADTLTDFFYRDESGGTWMLADGTSLGPGQRATLVKQEKNRLPDWLDQSLASFSSTLKTRIRSMQKSPNRYFARLQDPAPLALPTHPGIRWDSTELLLTGTPQKTGSASVPFAPTATNQ